MTSVVCKNQRETGLGGDVFFPYGCLFLFRSLGVSIAVFTACDGEGILGEEVRAREFSSLLLFTRGFDF